MPADGIEEREFDTADRYERDIDQLDLDEQLADEARDEISTVPVRCIVYAHDWHPRTHYCRRCGQDRNDELNQTRVWL